jgi:hypothetical protein
MFMASSFIKYILIILRVFMCFQGVAALKQDTIIKSNPIIFAETFLGLSKGTAGGLGLGLEASYQFKSNLFSARYVGNVKIDNNGIISPVFPLPDLETRSTSEEFSILYGYRKISDGSAYSFSGGLSTNRYIFYLDKPNQQNFYIGFPFEANFQLFKKEKSRLRIYGLIPVGKPTALGSGFSVKAFGNISRNSYAGIAISYGFGYYKKY